MATDNPNKYNAPSRSSHVTVTHRVDRGRRVYLRVWRDRSFGWERYTVADGLETFVGYADGRLHAALEREIERVAGGGR